MGRVVSICDGADSMINREDGVREIQYISMVHPCRITCAICSWSVLMTAEVLPGSVEVWLADMPQRLTSRGFDPLRS